MIDNKHVNGILVFLTVLSMFALLDLGFATSLENSTIMTVFIKNTAPTVIFANITPNPATPNQVLAYYANISDPNRDTIVVNITYYNATNINRSGIISVTFTGHQIWQNNTYTLPANAEAGVWYVNATISDGYVTVVNRTSFTVNAMLATGLQNTPIDFGNQTVGQTAQRAENAEAVQGVYLGDAIRGYPLLINNTGNTFSNYTINGSDLYNAAGSVSIGVANVTWNLTNASGVGTRDGKFALSATHALVNRSVGAGSTQPVYFWIDTPNNVSEARYNGTVVIVSNSE